MNDKGWTRGVGTGIGMSDHQNSFRPGVCLGNWVETRVATGCPQPLARFDAITTQRADYSPQGKFGLDLVTANGSDRLGRTYACTHRDLLFKHGDKARPPCSSFCSLKELTMGEPCIGAPRVQQCMWTGRNRADAPVPLSTSHYQTLLTTKMQKWQDESSDNPYISTSQAAQRRTLMEAGGLDWRRESCKPALPVL